MGFNINRSDFPHFFRQIVILQDFSPALGGPVQGFWTIPDGATHQLWACSRLLDLFQDGQLAGISTLPEFQKLAVLT